MTTGPMAPVFRLGVLLMLISSSSAVDMCRDKFRLQKPEDFRLYTCSWCYFFLFQSKVLLPSYTSLYLTAQVNRSLFSKGDVLIPDLQNVTLSTIICSTLTSAQCDRWQMCCHSAEDCCNAQISAPQSQNGTCKRTWDGYGCWEDTVAGTQNQLSCPSFLQYSVPTRFALKTCLANGTWLKVNGREWTDYTPCLDKQGLVASIYLSLGCNLASILLLGPAFTIFLVYRSLRRQHRIRLHMNFFLSFITNDVMTILWDMLVTYDRLTNDDTSSTVLYQNGTGCKILSFFRLYFKSTNYLWMFCEGFYLHRLISNAFKPPKSLKLIYIGGWGTPLIYTAIYSILRIVWANESCWAKSFGNYEWIIYVPNLMCLIMNLFFLCNILRVLLTQLQTHPNEPSNFRRALKATFVLIPLFGLQLFVTLYRIPTGTMGAKEYEMFTVLVINSQGFFVALIFCFFNGEVISHLRRTCTRLRLIRSLVDNQRGQTMVTSYSVTQNTQRDENGTYVYNDSPYSSPVMSTKKKRVNLEMYDTKYGYSPVSHKRDVNCVTADL